MQRHRAARVDEVTDAVLLASRALVAIASRSLAEAGSVTLPQYRTLVVLQSRGPRSVGELAVDLGVAASTATRMCDRLVDKGLVDRVADEEDRRMVRVGITETGAAVVGAVSRRRRQELRAIVSAMSEADGDALLRALSSFNRAAGEVPDDDWYLGWT